MFHNRRWQSSEYRTVHHCQYTSRQRRSRSWRQHAEAVRAVSPSVALYSMSAPSLRRKFTISTWPRVAAKIRAVSWVSVLSKITPFSTRLLTTSSWPLKAAMRSRDHPCLSHYGHSLFRFHISFFRFPVSSLNIFNMISYYKKLDVCVCIYLSVW